MKSYTDLKITDILAIAKDAGDRIMSYRGNVTAEYKADDSPVTKADKEASQIVIEGLGRVTPDIPVVSEENNNKENLEALKSDVRWVVDPLDGTRTFLNGRSGFGVHIALVDKGEPVKGVVFFPAKGENGRFYYTGDDQKAYKKEGFDGVPELIEVSKSFEGRLLRAAVHYKEEKRPADIEGHFYEAVYGVGGGRLCIAAEGKADIGWMTQENVKWAYSHWDVAAAHAVLNAAGGAFVDLKTGKAITYSNKNFAIPNAVAGHRKVLTQLLHR